MKYIGKAPVRISLCNGGDTSYYIEKMGWGNLISATTESCFYLCEAEPKNSDFIEYIYKNTFYKKEYKEIIKDIKKEKSEKVILITKTLSKIFPDFKGTIKITTNIPDRSGLGGSSSLVVSLIKALTKAKGEKKPNPEKIAKLAYDIERKDAGISGGYQDQWAAAFGGGVNYLEFTKNGVFIEPLWLSEKLMKKLENLLVLFFLERRKKGSGEIHKELEKRVKSVKGKKDIDLMKIRRENVVKTREALLTGDVKKFAELLKFEQESKSKLDKYFLTKKTKRIYQKALTLGAISGKISGAGFGGSAIFIYTKKDKKNFIKKMESLGCKNIPLRLERLNKMGEW